MNIANFNKPRPRWASATSKLLRTASIAVSAAFFVNGSMMGIFVTQISGAVADFILDLFPSDNEN